MRRSSRRHAASRMTWALLVLGLFGACGDDDPADVTGINTNNCFGDCNNRPDPTNNGQVTNNGADPDHEFGPAAPTDWTSFRNGAYRTGQSVGATVGPNVEEVWSIPNFLTLDYGAAKPSCAVWEDGLYCAADGGRMKAFDRFTGEELWSTDLLTRGNGIHGSPAVTRSAVFIGTYAGFMHALDRQTGQEVWRYQIGNVIGSSAVYVHEHEALYISHEIPRADPLPGGGYVTRNDPWTGEAVWVSPKLEHWPHASVAVDVERKVVMVGANDGVFHAYHTDTGEELWQRDFEPGAEFDPGTADIKTTASISRSRGLAVFGTWDNHVYALDVLTGEEAWNHDTGGRIMGSAALDDEAGVVYVPSLGSRGVCALDLDTGAERWCFREGGPSLSSPAVSGDGKVIVFGTQSARVYAVDAATGAAIWSFDTDGEQVTSSPALVGDMIYIPAKKGSLYALRTH